MVALRWKSLHVTFPHQNKVRSCQTLHSFSQDGVAWEEDWEVSETEQFLHHWQSLLKPLLSGMEWRQSWNHSQMPLSAPKMFYTISVLKRKEQNSHFPLQFLKRSPITAIINVLSYWASLYQESSVPSPRFWSSSIALQLLFYSP